MKVLVIDDIKDSVKEILDSCDENGWDKRLSGFDDAYSAIMEFDPDVIVLDWREDAENIDTGETILDKIWNITFRPVVLFTANAAIIDITSKREKSSMLQVISKGDEAPVINFLKGIERFASELSEYRARMSTALITSLNSIDHLKTVEAIEASAVGYILSKRTSAFFDDHYISELSPSWVQYLCPPISDCLNVCDIIRVKNAEADMASIGSPEEYLLILTPSCDMYHSVDRDPKVTHVLCGHCYPKEKFHGMGLSADPTEKQIERVQSYLSLGYNSSYVSLPGFANIIPYMTVDLKKIELVKIDEIAIDKSLLTDDKFYYRVASICSPFREQIVWAHLQNSCRPGVPDRNMELWAKEVLTK